MSRSRPLRVGLLACSAAAIAAAAWTSRIAFLAMAVTCLLGLALLPEQAGRLAESLRDFKGRSVDVVVWGASVQNAGVPLRVETVRVVGAGLLIYLIGSGASRTLLKVAQPRAWRSEEGRLVIDEAAYVQWARKRLARAEGCSAVSVILASGRA